MNLQFTNKGGNFVSEFEVTSDFNLHIEGVRLSDMHIYQKTAGGSYAKVTDFPSERSQDRVADFDFASLVYPKFIKVVCVTEPTNAELVTDGEVTEIKSQSKEVEITANGVTEIAPDAGFGYLSGVKVNVNVPQSGGGESGGGNKIEYFRIKDIAAFPVECVYMSMIATHLALDAISPTTGIIISPASMFGYLATIPNSNIEVCGLAIDFAAKAYYIDKFVTVDEFISQNGGSLENIANMPRISEDEFYNPATYA